MKSKNLYPPKGSAKALSMGPFDLSSNLLFHPWTKMRFQKHDRKHAFWNRKKSFVPRREVRKHSQGVQLISLVNYYFIRERKLRFQKYERKHDFWNRKKSSIVRTETKIVRTEIKSVLQFCSFSDILYIILIYTDIY